MGCQMIINYRSSNSNCGIQAAQMHAGMLDNAGNVVKAGKVLVSRQDGK